MTKSVTRADRPALRRRSRTLLGLTLVLLALTLALPAWASAFMPVRGGAGWSAQTSGSTAWLSGVTFVDATHGWAVGDGGTILATSTGGGPPVKARYTVTPPAVPARVRAGTGVEAWGTVKPALTGGDRITVFWEHYIGGRWDMVLARKPADSYRTVAASTRYLVKIVFAPGRWRVRATAGGVRPVTSAVRYFTAY